MHLQLQEVQLRRLAKESYCEERTQQLYWNQLLTIKEVMLLPSLPSSLLRVFRRPYYWAFCGWAITVFSIATSGIHNNPHPLERGESAEEYNAQQSYKQWHRIMVYQEKMGQLAMHNIKQGT